MGTLFVLLTVYGVLFRVLVLLGTDAGWTALVCLFFSVVTFGQMILFQGERPRAASIVSGALVCPAGLAVLIFDELITQWSGWAPIAGGLNSVGTFFAALLLLSMAGAGFGYVFGCSAAGVFYVLDKIRPNSEIRRGAAEDGTDRRAAQWVSVVGKWVNPAQPQNPLHGALAILLISMAFGFLISPFSVFTLRQLLGGALIVSACLVFWSGNLQHWFLWPVILTVAGGVAATPVILSLKQIAFVQDYFSFEPDMVTVAACFVGGIVGLSFSAMAGWIQWILFRKRGLGRLTRVPLLCLLASLFGVGVLVSLGVNRWSTTPTQQLFTKIKDEGGAIQWAGFNQTIWGITLRGDILDEDFRQLRPRLDGIQNLDLGSPKISDESIKTLSGLQLYRLSLAHTAITNNAFDGVTNLSASNVFLSDTEAGDPCLLGLVSIAEMQKSLQLLHLDRLDISEVGLSHLKVCPKLSAITFNGCQITEPMLASLAAVRRLNFVTLVGCSISDDALKTLVNSVPSLNVLSLKNTDVTDEGIAHLQQAKFLRRLDLSGTNVTPQAILMLESKLPNCSIHFDELSE